MKEQSKNKILFLKGRFEQKSNRSKPNGINLPANATIQLSNITKLKKELEEIQLFWKENKLIKNCLISVHYKQLIAKSNRIKGLFVVNQNPSYNSMVGAKYSQNNKKHIITHLVSPEIIQKSVKWLEETINIVISQKFDQQNFQEFIKPKIAEINFKNFPNLTKTKFKEVLFDSFYVERLSLPKLKKKDTNKKTITFFNLEENLEEVLTKIGIKKQNYKFIGENTIQFLNNDIDKVFDKAPFLISMNVEDIMKIPPLKQYLNENQEQIVIPLPKNEPTIGVIDTLFDTNVYFSQWVEFENHLDEEIPISELDFVHGTSVSSIIVDGPSFNKHLDDGCGRFKVKHFGVSTHGEFSSSVVINKIIKIIKDNLEIKVWNLSLGSSNEINDNFISLEASVLDEIQFKYDVIFVVSGTNLKEKEKSKKIGSPADSINSIVVNSVTKNKDKANYSREGIVLSFFTKPDVSFFGGNNEDGDYMVVCQPNGRAFVSGTSFAAPWISRKLSYLINVLGLNREVAKALLIDSAIGWDSKKSLDEKKFKGHGIVPVKIQDIINSENGEIKFLIEGVSEKYDTFNYRFPVPTENGKYPYVSKATLCYFPNCSRKQGVDYTSTELDIYFGRLKPDGNINSINDNKQSLETDDVNYLTEEYARKWFGKWDNVKHICELPKQRKIPKKTYPNLMWGMSIKTKERIGVKNGEGIKFGVVVTLHEINGINRIDDFVQRCTLNGWLVKRINIDNEIELYNKAEELIEFENNF
ncbi:S8 family peptidase [Mesoplasma corruscae]|uniref:Serine protease n=1 Tax=Mesoplasma corruscae TaxID=216874 RepID=A0A2S5RH72_9MOLU|nr:S8 family peptidase [Mesoplasma corruscae]PPE06650.1 serine protease [Mesoplasma corruscae]